MTARLMSHTHILNKRILYFISSVSMQFQGPSVLLENPDQFGLHTGFLWMSVSSYLLHLHITPNYQYLSSAIQYFIHV